MASSASSISQSASYDKPQGPSAVPFPIGQAQGMGASGPGGSSSSAGGGVNRYKIINDLKNQFSLLKCIKDNEREKDKVEIKELSIQNAKSGKSADLTDGIIQFSYYESICLIM